VRYVLDNTSDYNIPIEFVQEYKELNRTSRNRSKRSLSPISNKQDISSIKTKKTSSTSIIKPYNNENYKNNEKEKNISITKSKNENKQHKQNNNGEINKLNISKPIVILPTGLLEKGTIKLDTFTTLFNTTVATQFDSSVTHIVVSVDRNGAMKSRTMKYMQGLMGRIYINFILIYYYNINFYLLLAGVWIVQASWLSESIKNGI
jgi:hypothetical protein